jgi:hypothetical protein
MPHRTIVVSTVYGRNLSTEELDTINRHKKLEFNTSIIIAPKPGDDDWDKPYFLVRYKGELVAFGRLHTLQVEFESEPYTILGIATIIAIQKGRGYGAELMSGMKRYIVESELTAIGFCDPLVSAFYETCGYSIISHGVARFQFLDKDKRAIGPPRPNDDVVYLDGRDGLARNIRVHQSERVITFREAW